jgi:tetratricopeptide (TPR) repeat protein
MLTRSLFALALAAANLPWASVPLYAQPAGIPQEDPFADELNPFGSGQRKTPQPEIYPNDPATPQPRVNPPMAPAQGGDGTGITLPVPFPDVTVPGPAADRPTARTGRSLYAESPAAPLIAKARDLEKEEKWEEALATLKEAVEADPQDPEAHLAMGIVLRRLGRLEPAIEAFSKGLQIDPLEPELMFRRGIVWFRLGQYGIALKDFEDASGIAYDDPRPELWRGLALMKIDRPLEAISAYAGAIRRDRTYMVAYLNRGLAYLATDEPRKAELDFDQAIRHEPKDARAWFNRGVAQARQEA